MGVYIEKRLIFNNTLGEAHPLNQAGLSPEAKCIPNKYYRSLVWK